MTTTTETPAKNLRVARCAAHGAFAWPGSDDIGCPVCGRGLATTTRRLQAPWQVLDREEARQASRLPGGLPGRITWEQDQVERLRQRLGAAQTAVADGSRELDEKGTAWKMREPYDFEIAQGETGPQRSAGENLPGLEEAITKGEQKVTRLQKKLEKLGGPQDSLTTTTTSTTTTQENTAMTTQKKKATEKKATEKKATEKETPAGPAPAELVEKVARATRLNGLAVEPRQNGKRHVITLTDEAGTRILAYVDPLKRGGFRVLVQNYGAETPGTTVQTPAEAAALVKASERRKPRKAVVKAAAAPVTYTARQLRVVDNNTEDYEGGYSVELKDGSVLAGPYAVKKDAKDAKAALMAGQPVQAAR